jgi:hypothetical protein
MKWSAFGAGVVVASVVVATLVLAIVGAVSAKIVAGVLQLLGIALPLLGVAVVRASFVGLKPGRYVLICNLPEHYARGMHAAFRVT